MLLRFRFCLLTLLTAVASLTGCPSYKGQDGGNSSCTSGSLGCACLPDQSCNAAADGAALTCSGGVCQRAACVPGNEGCACTQGQACKAGLNCGMENGTAFCQLTSCQLGAVDCTCHQDQTCAQGLTCQSGHCVDPTSTCPAGTQGCSCRSGNTCGAGLHCASGTCRNIVLPPEDTTPPLNPTCHTPCRTGITDSNGAYRACSAEGLLEGCLAGQQCDHGSCVSPDAGAQADPGPLPCNNDVDCPDFQACIQGGCYSNCEYDSDCSTGRKCYRRVCRQECSTATAGTCEDGKHCEIVDSEHGYCMATPEPTGTPVRTSEGALAAAPGFLSFSNTLTQSHFTITNPAPHLVTVTVTKKEHGEFQDTGRTVVTENPLHWLTMGVGTPMQTQSFTVNVEANGTVDVLLGGAANPALSRWDGQIEITADHMGPSRVNLEYASLPDGRWEGKMYFFANFADGARPDGTIAINEWMSARSDGAKLDTVGNAFLQRWDAFKRGVLSYDEFQAVLSATQSGSWKYSNVMHQCRTNAASRRACYLYSAGSGMIEYTSDVNTYAIPSGVSELPLSINLRTAGDMSGQVLQGKIITDESMHYAGDPAVSLTFANAPTSCTTNANGTCLVNVQDFGATIAIGGRYLTDETDTACSKAAPGTFELTRTPWLVPGFVSGTSQDPNSGLRYRWECRDKTLPYGADASRQAINQSFAQSNPVPDGRSRLRTLELVDGAMINQDSLFVMFRERFPSVLGTQDGTINAYGYIILSRAAATLPQDAYAGTSPVDTRTQPDVLNVGCSDAVLHGGDAPVLVPGETLSATNSDRVATAMISGQAPKVGQTAQPLDATSAEKVHYFCEDTGLFDGGPLDSPASGSIKQECPVSSKVTFFTLDGITDLSGEACQHTHRCQDTLNAWAANNSNGLRLSPTWRCANSNEVYCDANRLDVRVGKLFFSRLDSVSAFVPVRAEIQNAFRFKTRFRNRTTGQNVGFAPLVCVPNSDAVPYCYDPPAIEQIRARVDCALHIHSTPQLRGTLAAATAGALTEYLEENFSYTTTMVNGTPFTHDGFERLYAELLIMQGDEAYTRAFASRFDLAGSNLVAFEGTRFEPNGINLSGAAGYEMYNLYLAAQYHQMALDRFYTLGPELQALITQLGSGAGLKIVDSYFGRLIRASTQKARAWSEVAKRYSNFNQPELARNVIRRAYAAAYLESVVLARMMLRVITFADPADRDQIVKTAELAQLGYRAALLDMRDVFKGITDDVNFFGFAPDYIPFPVLEAGETNAFRKIFAVASQKVQTAAVKETQALQSSRSFDVDAAAFQAELTRVSNNYDNQLADICGTFDAGDGNAPYPAIPKYAYLSTPTSVMGDPCGLVGSGRLHDAMGNYEITALNNRSVAAAQDQLLGEVEIERARVNAQCGLTLRAADYEFTVDGQVLNLQDAISAEKTTISTAQRSIALASSIASLNKCIVIGGASVGSDCPTAAAAAAVFTAAATAAEAASIASETVIALQVHRIAEIQRSAARWKTAQQCEVAQVDSDARVKTMLLQLEGMRLDALKAAYQSRLAIADIIALRHQATRLIAEQEESEQLTINVEAARNDPNVRIYKNDSILTADRTFHGALKTVYQATKVYEYYTSQSYGRLNNLFLIRMVASGDISLEQYLTELSDAFDSFEATFRNPQTRPMVISLRDDILDIPRLDSNGQPLSQAQRVAVLRQEISDVKRLDARGYISIPFTTRLDVLSPLTRNHKIKSIEAEIIGSDIGDTVGRVYLTQKGTGAVRPVSGSTAYYSLPQGQAVVDAFFNGQRVWPQDVYANLNLQERPLVNTAWELIFNQKDEAVNKDINLQSLTDIKLYILYTDFTAVSEQP